MVYSIINTEGLVHRHTAANAVPEQAIRLDVLGLPSGKYTIDVNGSRGEFELKADN